MSQHSGNSKCFVIVEYQCARRKLELAVSPASWLQYDKKTNDLTAYWPKRDGFEAAQNHETPDFKTWWKYSAKIRLSGMTFATYEEAESYIGKAIEESDSCNSNVEKNNFQHRTSFARAKLRDGPRGDAHEDDEEDDDDDDNNTGTSQDLTALVPPGNFSTNTIATISKAINHTMSGIGQSNNQPSGVGWMSQLEDSEWGLQSCSNNAPITQRGMSNEAHLNQASTSFQPQVPEPQLFSHSQQLNCNALEPNYSFTSQSLLNFSPSPSIVPTHHQQNQSLSSNLSPAARTYQARAPQIQQNLCHQQNVSEFASEVPPPTAGPSQSSPSRQSSRSSSAASVSSPTVSNTTSLHSSPSHSPVRNAPGIGNFTEDLFRRLVDQAIRSYREQDKKIQYQLEEIRKEIKEVRNAQMIRSSTPQEEKVVLTSKYPAETIEHIEDLSKELKDSKKFQSLKKKLVGIGGTDAEDCLKRAVNDILGYCIAESVRERFPETDLSTMEKYFKEFIKGGKARHDRSLARQKRTSDASLDAESR